MKNMPMCPMMMPMHMNKMPMHMQMPMMQPMPMHMMQMPMMQPMQMQDMMQDEDERDDEHFLGMYGDTSQRMMPFVLVVVDKMDQKGDMLYDEYPTRDMVDRMTDDAYGRMVKDMPDMSDEMQEERQQFGRRRFSRDLLRILLLNELFRRRRRRRRFDHGHFGWEDNGYDDYNDFYYND